jgi:hypothetical protein
MAESIQRIPKRRDGQPPTRPEEIIAWLEGAARGWNREPTPFIWSGKRPTSMGSAERPGCRWIRRLDAATTHPITGGLSQWR